MASRFQHTVNLHIIIFLQIVHLTKGQLRIIPPYDPVLGVVGMGVTLPCQLEAKTISEGVLVQWTVIGNPVNYEVTTYDGRNAQNPVKENKAYLGRTNFFLSEVTKGNLSLHLKNVMVSDKGKYICSVSLENWYDEVVVDLNVAAQAKHSAVHMDGHVDQGIGVTCKSQGWFPQPEVIWLDSKGQTRKEKVVTQRLQTSSGLFDVVSSMALEPGTDMEVSCRIVNDILNTACESRVLVSEVFFPSTSPWMTAFLVIIFCAVAVIAAAGYKLKIHYTRKQKEETTMDELKKNKEDLEKDLDSEKRTRDAGYSATKHWLDILECELDFWKAQDKAVPFTVNSECQLLKIQVPGAPDVESNATEPADLSSPSTIPVLVAKEGFASGKHYWEVDVGQQQDWVLGVMRHKGKQEEQGILARGDFWALQKTRGEVFSIKGNNRPEKKEMNDAMIGVLLDLEEAQVYFYDAKKRSKALRISISLGKESAEVFHPFLSKGELRFMPVCHQNIPVPLTNP
ncbi:butyrophilin subfamily 3 member A2-like isoform X1 [Tympanuchus pallidicinctus]|uniref:butyrophilin subfamily 3 member A2-like isoform X1 n=1 Tax=Tympanuchus pallidicinctus TaxID=109042 RepID=UPI002286D6CF|nr:butyrophilin subfamily 3 member A2-like isoform X1 [Tympanuchus pallidicinctus]